MKPSFIYHYHANFFHDVDAPAMSQCRHRTEKGSASGLLTLDAKITTELGFARACEGISEPLNKQFRSVQAITVVSLSFLHEVKVAPIRVDTAELDKYKSTVGALRKLLVPEGACHNDKRIEGVRMHHYCDDCVLRGNANDQSPLCNRSKDFSK